MVNSNDLVTIFWFRRDLRLEDNTALIHALESKIKVLPIFIFDPNIISELPSDDARVTFIHRLLENLNRQLAAFGTSVAVFYEKPVDVFKSLATELQITSVFANKDHEPYAQNRDASITEYLSKSGIQLLLFKDHVIFEENEIVKDDGSPYVVFTPFSRRWKAKYTEITLKTSQRVLSANDFAAHSYPFLSLPDIGFKESSIKVADFNASEELLANYEATRNFPGLNKTSRLSPHLRFGSVSIRTIVALAYANKMESFVNELIWREFFIQILWHFPQTVSRSFRPKYDRIKWRNDEIEFKKWCEGQTGYPIVDAGMRELNATGFMQNRVRMIVASFLCKHLLIDWRWGEAYFALKLLDYEQASNVGNWQWAAGSGVDAAPYFRIFNPSEQVKKFDKDLVYIRKWVPELEEFSYPEPIVDHKEARERCLRVYKEALG
ncbi:MAG TPA: deoxyribodipyrimidine photo-lyase [Flavobacterium sp.]|jgi:deoxyribodipyrimidine photo-lyase